jgi:hypothetical protein
MSLKQLNTKMNMIGIMDLYSATDRHDIHTSFSGETTDTRRLALGLVAVFFKFFVDKSTPSAVSLAPFII